MDYGDAPDPTYPTLVASNGARHTTGGALVLGALSDADADGQPTVGADGDDTDGTDDEDGVVFATALRIGSNATINITASAPGLVDAWIDYNGDGDWADAGEQILASQAVVAGINAIVTAVPAGASSGVSYARFRISTAGGLAPVGLAADGEVEDYQVTVLFWAVAIPTMSTISIAILSLLLGGIGISSLLRKEWVFR